MVLYFVLVIAYDTWAFAREARRTSGVTRRRMQAVAVGTACLGLILVLAGVTISDPSSTFIDVDVEIGEDSTIEPFSFLKGQVAIGARSTVGPLTTLIDCVIGDDGSPQHTGQANRFMWSSRP